MSEILPQSPEPCPCSGCKDRHFNEETKRTCHCDCERYEKWASDNRKRHEERYKAHLVLGCVGVFNLGRMYENILNLRQEMREEKQRKKGDTDEQNDR